MNETSKISPNVMNLAMPRGRLSFAPLDDDGETTGEVDLGNVTSLDLTNAIAYKEHLTSHDSVVVLDAKKPSEQKYTVKFTPDEQSAENFAMFFLGDPDKCKAGGDREEQTGSTEAGKSVVLFYDRWIDLGKKYIKPGASSIVLTGTTTLTINATTSGNYPNDGYAVDFESGMVMVYTAFGFTDGETVQAYYKYGTVSLKKFIPRIRPLIGFMRYRGVSEVGPRYEIKCWKVQITPDAALNLIKPSDYANLGFSGDVYKDDDTNSHPDDPFFSIVELDEASSYPS